MYEREVGFWGVDIFPPRIFFFFQEMKKKMEDGNLTGGDGF